MVNPEILLINNSLSMVCVLFVYIFLYFTFMEIYNMRGNRAITLPFSSSSLDDVFVNI